MRDFWRKKTFPFMQKTRYSKKKEFYVLLCFWRISYYILCFLLLVQIIIYNKQNNILFLKHYWSSYRSVLLSNFSKWVTLQYLFYPCLYFLSESVLTYYGSSFMSMFFVSLTYLCIRNATFIYWCRNPIRCMNHGAWDKLASCQTGEIIV